jgi:hypothetical protein
LGAFLEEKCVWERFSGPPPKSALQPVADKPFANTSKTLLLFDNTVFSVKRNGDCFLRGPLRLNGINAQSDIFHLTTIRKARGF